MMYKAYNTCTVRAEVIRNGGTVAILEAYDAPTVMCDIESELILSMRGTFLASEKPNFYTDRIRLVMTLNGEDHPMGTFRVAAMTKRGEHGVELTDIEAYSLLYMAKQKKTEERIHLAAGTNYISACTALLASAGITDIEAAETAETLSTDREDWEIGTEILHIVNELLSEIAYEGAFVSLDGVVQLKPYTAPAVDRVKHTYTEGEASVIAPEYTLTDDRWEMANVFIVVCENPEIETMMMATAENDIPESPYSTVNAGRIVHVERMENAPGQEALQARANMLRDRSLQAEEVIQFQTAISPGHEPHDTVAIQVGKLSGIFEEVGWSMELSATGMMEHRAKRVIA